MSGLEGWRRWTTIAATAGTGAAGGVFLAYSAFTMAALRNLPPAQGLRAMQSINRSAERSGALMVCLFGTAAACVALGVAAARDAHDRVAALQLVAGGVYLVGVVGTTIGFHVPRNEALMTVDPDAADAAARWAAFARAWTAGNHVRTVTGIGAAALYALSLRRR